MRQALGCWGIQQGAIQACTWRLASCSVPACTIFIVRADSATYLAASIHFGLAVDLVGARFPGQSVGFEGPVAVWGVAAAVAHCRHAGSGEAVSALGFAEGAAVRNMARCMPLPGSTGHAAAVGGFDLAGPVARIRSHLDNHHVAAHSPMPPGHSGRCPIAHCLPGRSRNHSIADRTAGRSDCRNSAAAVFGSVFLGRGIVVEGVRGCRIAAGVPCRRCYRGKRGPDAVSQEASEQVIVASERRGFSS